jgi:CRP-like cAMP-binding protein
MNVDTIHKKISDKRRLYLNKYSSYNSFMTKSPMREIVNESAEKQILVFKKNEYLFHENGSASGIYLILTGKVKIITDEDKSVHTILYLVKPGDILGIHAIINGHNYTNSAVALVNTEVCFIPDYEFFHLIDNNNKYKMVVMQLLCSRIDLIENQITSRNERSALERFAELLILLHDTYGTNDKQVLRIELSLGELASLSGTSKGYLSKIIGDCCQKNIISIHGKNIKIIDKKELESLANI